jgi:hypothetical protein
MQNINKPNTNQYPFWTPPFGIQNPRQIVGGGIDSMIEDLQFNRIPSETDFLNSDIRTIPTPQTNIDTKTALTFETHRAQLGRGSAIGLTDLLLMSQLEVDQIGRNE